MSQQVELDRIIASLYKAMLDDSHWHATSALIEDACGVAAAHLVLVSGRIDGDAQWLSDKATSSGWESEQVALIERLLPHIRQFVRVRQALAGAVAVGASLSGLLDNMLIGVLCLDWRGMIVQANARAREILRRGEGLVDREGFLGAQTAEDDLRLRRLLESVLPRFGCAGSGGSIAVARASARPRVALHLTPVKLGDTGFGLAHVAALGLIVDPLAKPCIDSEHVAATLGLTAAEGRVAAALAGGATMREIATATHRAESTVHELSKTHPRQAGHLPPRRPGPHGPLAGRPIPVIEASR